MPAARKTGTPALEGAGLGRIAYEAYGKAAGDASTWDVLVKENPDVAAAWCASAQAVITATFERKQA